MIWFHYLQLTVPIYHFKTLTRTIIIIFH